MLSVVYVLWAYKSFAWFLTYNHVISQQKKRVDVNGLIIIDFRAGSTK